MRWGECRPKRKDEDVGTDKDQHGLGDIPGGNLDTLEGCSVLKDLIDSVSLCEKTSKCDAESHSKEPRKGNARSIASFFACDPSVDDQGNDRSAHE